MEKRLNKQTSMRNPLTGWGCTMNVCKSPSIFLFSPKTAHRVHRPTSKEPTRDRYTEGSRKNTKYANSSHAVTNWIILLIALSRCSVSTSGLVAWVPCLTCCRKLNMSELEAPALSEANISVIGSASACPSEPRDLGLRPNADTPLDILPDGLENGESILTGARRNRSCSSGDHTESSIPLKCDSGVIEGDGAEGSAVVSLLVIGPDEGEIGTREGVDTCGLPSPRKFFERDEASVHIEFQNPKDLIEPTVTSQIYTLLASCTCCELGETVTTFRKNGFSTSFCTFSGAWHGGRVWKLTSITVTCIQRRSWIPRQVYCLY